MLDDKDALGHDALFRCSARGKLHLKSCTFAGGRLDPDAALVHLHDLLGDGEAQARAALGLGVGAVDLVELLEDPIFWSSGMRSRCSPAGPCALVETYLCGPTVGLRSRRCGIRSVKRALEGLRKAH